MANRLILATSSQIRIRLFQNAGIPVVALPARIDEGAIKSALVNDGARPRDIADALAQQKAQKIGLKHPEDTTIGCDQILELDGTLMGKPGSPDDAAEQLSELSGTTHSLFSSAVIFSGGAPIWRHVGSVKLQMRPLSNSYISDYVERNWESIRHSVGGYKLEEEGIRLFHRVDGDYFHVLGLPFLEIVNYLIERGQIPG